MKNVFLKPYPYIFTYKKLPQISFIFFIIVFLIVYLFRPFDVNFSEHNFNYLTVCIIQAFSASLNFFIFFNLFNLISRKLRLNSEWSIYKETITIFFALTFKGIGGFLIRNIIYNNPRNISLRYFVEEILHAWLVGSVIFVIYTVINYLRLSTSNKEEIKNLSNDAENEGFETPKIISIETQVKSDCFDLDVNQFLIAKADGNYVEIYFETSQRIVKKIVRLSLKNLENQLESFKFITRSHRTFLVNTKKVKNVSGNSLGYELKFDKLDFQVPVSRGNIKNFNFIMNQK